MIRRAKSDHFRKLCAEFPVVGIVGPRQVGKTTLAKQLANTIKKPSIYLDLELDSDNALLQNAEMFLKGQENKCVIIDEIQRMPRLFTLLRALVDQKRVPSRFIILGSATPSLIQKGADTLAGRIAFEELTPFNLPEIGKRYNMKQHWLRGGFPEMILAKNDEVAFRRLRNFINSYVERDLAQLGLITDTMMLRKFWEMLAHYHSGIWNSSNFARALGISVTTVSRYLGFLENSFMAHTLHPFYFSIKKRLIKAPKVYIRDSGILHALTGINNWESLTKNIMIGASWEGYAVEQIKSSLPDGYSTYYYRTHDGTEVDLVFAKGNKPVATAEIKHSTAPKITRGQTIAIGDLKTKKNFIICFTKYEFPLRKDIIACNLEIFLKKHLPEL